MPLYRQENPALFWMVQDALVQQENMGPFSNNYEISDEDLDKIEEMSDFDDLVLGERGLRTLDGIEKLKNLKSLIIRGRRTDAISNFAQDKVMDDIYDIKDTSAGVENIIKGILSNRANMAEEMMEYNQLEDISALKKCRNLQILGISSQLYLDDIDLTKNKNLKQVIMIDCPALKSVKGLDTLDIDSRYDNVAFNFTGCIELKEIKNFDKFKENIMHFPAKRAQVHLPLNYYSSVTRKYKDLLSDEPFNRSKIFSWTEDMTEDIPTSEAYMIKSRVDNILKSICHKQDSDVQKIFNVYKYICENYEYDNAGLIRESNVPIGVNIPTSHTIRSAFHAMKRGKAVCLGLARLFNFFLSEAGFDAEEVICTAMEMPIDNKIVDINHAISKVTVGGMPYYFDPTWDMYRKDMAYFMLNKEEMEQKQHILNYLNKNVVNAPSVQEELKEMGLDLTNSRKNAKNYNYNGLLDGDTLPVNVEELGSYYTPPSPCPPKVEDKYARHNIYNVDDGTSPKLLEDKREDYTSEDELNI